MNENQNIHPLVENMNINLGVLFLQEMKGSLCQNIFCKGVSVHYRADGNNSQHNEYWKKVKTLKHPFHNLQSRSQLAHLKQDIVNSIVNSNLVFKIIYMSLGFKVILELQSKPTCRYEPDGNKARLTSFLQLAQEVLFSPAASGFLYNADWALWCIVLEIK